MNYCRKCQIDVENELNGCPLCQGKLDRKPGLKELDFTKITFPMSDTLGFIRRILFFVFVLLVGLNITFNIILSISLFWAPYFIVVLFYAYFMMAHAMKSSRNMGLTIMTNVYLLSAMLLLLDAISGFHKWSIHYVIPFLVVIGILSLDLLISIRKSNHLDYLIYMFVVVLFGLALFPFLLLGLIEVVIPTMIAIYISFMTIIGMVVFGNKQTFNEFVKRFHI